MQLVTEKIRAQFRGPTSSSEFNEFISNAHYDLTQLYDLAVTHDVKIPNNLDMVLTQNYFLRKKIDELSDLIANIEASLEDPSNYTSSFSNPNSSSQVGSEPLIYTDEEYGVAYQQMEDSVSKVYILDKDDNTVVPESLEVTLYESTSPISDLTDIDNGLKVDIANTEDIFDGDKNNPWIRKFSTESPIDSIYAVFHIKLPSNIVNHYRVNNITLNPYPEFSKNLLDIQYKGSSSWHRLPTYPEYEDGGNIHPLEIEDIPRTRLIFSHQDITELLIYIKQDQYIEDGSSRIFPYGFYNIGISYTRFEETDGKMLIEFTHPQVETKGFEVIQDIIPILSNTGLDREDLVSTKLYLDEGVNEEGELGGVIPALYQDNVFIEVTLSCDSTGTPPMLEGMKIEYTSIDKT